MGQIFFLFAVVISLSLTVNAVRRSEVYRVAIGTIATLVYVFCLWTPAHLQQTDTIVSKLFRAGLTDAPTLDEIDRLSLQWAVELAVVVVCEALVWAWRPKAPKLPDPVRGLISPERTALVLVVVGTLSTIIFRVPGLDERAAGGQGFPTLMRTALICGLSIIIYYHGFRNWRYWLLCGVGTSWLVFQNVRSPLFVLFFAYLASQMIQAKHRSPKRTAMTVVLVVCLALGGSLMSSLRANIVRGTGYSFSEVVDQTLANPLVAPFQAGIDTLDGYRFSEKLLPLIEPQPLDLLNTVTTFIPRSVWAEKPRDLSVELSATYLGYKGSGQYLSPVGYLSLVTGSHVGAVLALGVFVIVLACLLRKYRTHFWSAIILCVAFRFFLGGSSFDLYYGLTLVVPILAVQAWFTLLQPKRYDPDSGSSPQTNPAGNEAFVRRGP
ncbi:hypothetical protein [Pseudarthrobacter sp. B4EP4b]|uniref:hypothetical protein n=1 Tax=Pseudarthrobacter sp. B4EP4b TaxID=2590664 RepID=UPI0011528A70|nr:hypothetical protein [Pseudarthrobacter sp. B4EP4b]